MQFVFADEATQSTPTRDGMGPIISFGGIWIGEDKLADLERELDGVCTSHGFPAGEEFKWSPHRGQWMAKNLVDDARRAFQVDVVQCAANHGVRVSVVVEATNAARASQKAKSHEHDVTIMFLERVSNRLNQLGEYGVVVVDHPGDKKERKLTQTCKEILTEGSEYVKPGERIAINVLCGHSHHMRVLQLADLVTGCTTAYVAGENAFSPPIMDQIKPLLWKNDVVGGIGIKIHPDFRYMNLYHWLFGDNTHWRVMSGSGVSLPNKQSAYPLSADKA